MKQVYRLLAIIAILLPSVVSAHPGHDHSEGDQGFTIIHYFTTPVHVVTSFAVLAIVVGILRAIRTRSSKI
jgi:hypothetical protein